MSLPLSIYQKRKKKLNLSKAIYGGHSPGKTLNRYFIFFEDQKLQNYNFKRFLLKFQAKLTFFIDQSPLFSIIDLLKRYMAAIFHEKI